MRTFLRDHFGCPEEVLPRFRARPPQHIAGIVPNYLLGDYVAGCTKVGFDPDHIRPSYSERWFYLVLGVLSSGLQAQQPGVFLIHAPKTNNHDTGARNIFMRTADVRPQGEATMLPVWVVTRGVSYTTQWDKDHKNVPITQAGYDGTEVAVEEGRNLGVLTVVLEQKNLSLQVAELLSNIRSGVMPRSR